MTRNDDFFGALEQQLVTATTERATRLRRARMRRAGLLSTILVAVLAAGGGLAAAMTSTDSSSNAGHAAAGGAHTATTATTATTPAPIVRKGAPDWPAPGTFEVSVLNGTPTPDLARYIANNLSDDQHKIGVITNAAAQDVATTQVYYASDACFLAAQEVAHALQLPIASIRPATPGVRAIAGDRAKVIVLVGADQDTAPRTR